VAEVTDDGVEEYESPEWGDDDSCTCGQCHWSGTVSDFLTASEG
jgi:hypothetical protein